jgi:hypothetical protein
MAKKANQIANNFHSTLKLNKKIEMKKSFHYRTENREPSLYGFAEPINAVAKIYVEKRKL